MAASGKHGKCIGGRIQIPHGNSDKCIGGLFQISGNSEEHFILSHGKGGLGLHQLMWNRPAPGFSGYKTPLQGLYICGAGAHPGGGVMGACGANAAHVALRDLQRGRV